MRGLRREARRTARGESEGENGEESEEGSGDYYKSEDPACLEALAAALAASKRLGLWDFGQQGLSSSGAGPSVVAAEGTSVSASVPVSPTTPARVFRSGTLHLSAPPLGAPSREGQGGRAVERGARQPPRWGAEDEKEKRRKAKGKGRAVP